jgi:hypothetical protein
MAESRLRVEVAEMRRRLMSHQLVKSKNVDKLQVTIERARRLDREITILE